MVSLNDFIDSFKVQDYQCDISLIKKCFIDEMLNQNFSFDKISQATCISKYDIWKYFHNEWCYSNQERYCEIMFVKWINSVALNENVKTK